MDLIEDIGPVLGIVAFLGFAVLALLIVLQAREVRRLREWAGRAPERAAEADSAAQSVGEARGEPAAAEPGRLAALRERFSGSFGRRWSELDRRSPVDPRWLIGLLAAGVIAAAVLTSGFGLVGDDEGRRGGSGAVTQQRNSPVAVLNATQVEDDAAPVPGVAGLADAIAQQVVEPAGFDVATTGDAPSGLDRTVVMYQPQTEAAADRLATQVSEDLGETETEPMTEEIRAAAGRAGLALVIGRDDAGFGGLSAETVAP